MFQNPLFNESQEAGSPPEGRSVINEEATKKEDGASNNGNISAHHEARKSVKDIVSKFQKSDNNEGRKSVNDPIDSKARRLSNVNNLVSRFEGQRNS